MSRDSALYLDDIILACEKIVRNTAGMEKDEFLAHDIMYDAVVRNLEIISEASQHIPVEILDRFPGVDWKKIKGLRVILAHCYFRIDPEVLWDIVISKVPPLLEALRSGLNSTR